MATDGRPRRADRPNATVREAVLDRLAEEDVLPIRQYGVGGARYVYERLSVASVGFDGPVRNYRLDPGTVAATAVDGDATFPAVGRLGALHALAPATWRLRRLISDGRRDSVPLRVYGSDDGPTVVYLHGGGFVIGSVESHDVLCRALAAESTATVVSVGYRLAPEHPHPTPTLDGYAALEWAARRFGADTLVVGGDSAGGTVASLVALLARDRDVPAIDRQWLLYPVAEEGLNRPSCEEFAEGYLLERADMEWFEGKRFERGRDPDQPAYALAADSLVGLPETTLVTAGFDPLRDEGFALAAALEAAGIAVDHRNYPAMIHGFAALLDDPSVETAWETVRHLVGTL